MLFALKLVLDSLLAFTEKKNLPFSCCFVGFDRVVSSCNATVFSFLYFCVAWYILLLQVVLLVLYRTFLVIKTYHSHKEANRRQGRSLGI